MKALCDERKAASRPPHSKNVDAMKSGSPSPQLILAVDTSTPLLSLAIASGAELLISIADDSTLPQAQKIFPLIHSILAGLNLQLEDIDAFAVNTGPGSFTGLRVGLASFKGMAATLEKPLLGISALDASALAAQVFDLPIAVIQNASRGEMYCGLRQVSADGSITQIGQDQVCQPESFLERLQIEFEDAEIVFVGSGANHLSSTIAALNQPWRVVEETDSLVNVIALHAGKMIQNGECQAAEAYYLKPPDAKIKLAK